MIAGLLSVLLAMAPPAERALSIELDDLEPQLDASTLDRFHGDLVLRLLEAGHAVGPHGAVQVWVRGRGDGVVVGCRLADVEHEVEVEGAAPAILALELIHRTVEVVDVCASSEDAASGADPRAGVVIDAAGLSAAELAELALTLIEQSVTLVADAQQAEARVCALGSSLHDGVFVVASARSCEDAADVPRDVDVAAAWRRWSDELDSRPTSEHASEPEPEPEPEPESEPEPEPSGQGRDAPEPEDPIEVEPEPGPRWQPSVGIGAGVDVRAWAAAPTIVVDLAGVHPSGVLIGVLGRATPSSADALVVVDASALALVGWQRSVSPRLAVRPSAGVGLSVHRFAFPDEQTGHLLGVGLRGAFELGVRMSPRWRFIAALAANVETRSIVHRVDGREAWSRGVVRVDALIGVRFGPG